MLFGDDLGKQVKELQEEQKATVGVMRFAQPQRGNYHPHQAHGGYNNMNFNNCFQAAGWKTSASAGMGGNAFLGGGQYMKNKQCFRNHNTRPMQRKPFGVTNTTAHASKFQKHT